MKKVAKVAGLVLAAVCVMGASVACQSPEESNLLIGKEFLAATSQLDALTKLDKGEADVAVIDSVMAGYYTSTGDYAEKMQIVENMVLAEEEYGIAAKKGNKAFVSKINEALIAIRETEYASITQEYNLTASIALGENATDPYAGATDNSWEEVKESGTIIIGYTIFAPIAYENEEGVLTGYDIELAKAVVAYLNQQYTLSLQVQFVEIDWNTKEAKLEDGTIDLVWNGMTITPERSAGMCISIPYLYNKQVAVVLKTDATKFTDKESMAEAIMTAEKGSAGESVIVPMEE